MNIHSLLTDDDQQSKQYKNVLNNISKVQEQRKKDRSTSNLANNHLRSFALKSAQKGDYTEAIALLNQLISRHPDNAVDYNNRGLIYFQSGKTQKALYDYNTALKLNPYLASAYNNRANYYAACGELAAALADYDRAIDLNPGYVRAWINRGITWRDLGQYEQAIENFEVALLFGQLEGHIWAERGRTYHLWGDWNCAIADYRRALTQLPYLDNSKDITGCRLRLQLENRLNELLSESAS
ncbi:MAG: tetratricopeptide repeat protein [Nostoc sp. DedVER02]|uniref:tetratricopeptide repeat protein n=1 Tax=unclassified Nostoc TaxID=2593658 RepID=UPI002AD53BB0|nr:MULTISPECIES: tetratricopeptide repeat protein [unclassified Nostoc]MDZ7986785.1 tetratricopeptide repeat protein [Nostoc sp. DedVER02]MDZ8115687.1 tetratricopeptide repeat protein [Nostoc sp. DedVER01b]